MINWLNNTLLGCYFKIVFWTIVSLPFQILFWYFIFGGHV